MNLEEYNKIINQYHIDTDNDYVCSNWPFWGRGTYSILYKNKEGKFIYEEGISDDGVEEEIWKCEEISVDEAKEYIKDYLELSAGLDPLEDLDELIRIWKDIFDEDIDRW